MSITDELREWAEQHKGWHLFDMQLTAIADRIDAGNESACAEAYGNGVMSVPIALDESQWVELPKDADGVPIRIGDELDYLEALHPDVPARFKVQDMFYFGNGEWRLRAYSATYEPKKCRHYHAPTVEDVLTEFGIDWEHESDCEDRAALLKEYASKLRLAEGGGRMMAFIAGLVIGSMLGVTVTALCAVGGDSPSAGRVIVADEETDCATGFCTCGNCGEPIDPWDAWCRWCGARMGDEC